MGAGLTMGHVGMKGLSCMDGARGGGGGRGRREGEKEEVACRQLALGWVFSGLIHLYFQQTVM